jgi:hypothetical protein
MAWTDPPSTYATVSGNAETPSFYPTYSWCPAVTQDGGSSVASIVGGIDDASVSVATWNTSGLNFPGSANQGLTMVSGVDTSTHTVSFLWKFDDVTPDQDLLCSYEVENAYPTWVIRYKSGPEFLIAHVNTTSGTRAESASYTAETGVWYTLTCRFELDELHDFWVGSGQLMSEPTLSSLGTFIDRLFFGSYYLGSGTGSNRSKGTLAGLHFWDRVLTSGEITTLTEDFWAPIREKDQEYRKVLYSHIGGFTSDMVGYSLYISGGTNANVGWFTISSFIDSNSVGLDGYVDDGSGPASSVRFTVYSEVEPTPIYLGKNLTANLTEWPSTLHCFGEENQSVTIAGTYTPSLNIAKSAGTVDINVDQLYNVDVSGCTISGHLDLTGYFNAVDATLSGVDVTCPRNFILDNTPTIETSVLLNGSYNQVLDLDGSSVKLLEVRKS